MLSRTRQLLIVALGLIASVAAFSQDSTPAKSTAASVPKTAEEVIAAANRICYYQGNDRSAQVAVDVLGARTHTRHSRSCV